MAIVLAEVIAHACWMKFEQGHSKPRVLEFRDACCSASALYQNTGRMCDRNKKKTRTTKSKTKTKTKRRKKKRKITGFTSNIK